MLLTPGKQPCLPGLLLPASTICIPFDFPGISPISSGINSLAGILSANQLWLDKKKQLPILLPDPVFRRRLAGFLLKNPAEIV